jgi:hypothetical protein
LAIWRAGADFADNSGGSDQVDRHDRPIDGHTSWPHRLAAVRRWRSLATAVMRRRGKLPARRHSDQGD